MSKSLHWEALFGAIILEVIGSTIMKLSQGWSFYGASVLGLAIMWAAVGFSYYLLAVSTMRIPAGVAYAFWEGRGLALITLSSYFILHENLDLKGLTGLACVLPGAWIVHRGTSPKKKMPILDNLFSLARLFVILAAIFDIAANLCVAASRGFRRKGYAIAAYILVGSAFYALYLAVRDMNLTTAYAMWGVFGVIGTVLGGWIMFKQTPQASGLTWHFPAYYGHCTFALITVSTERPTPIKRRDHSFP